jgi:hypothetical protein
MGCWLRSCAFQLAITAYRGFEGEDDVTPWCSSQELTSSSVSEWARQAWQLPPWIGSAISTLRQVRIGGGAEQGFCFDDLSAVPIWVVNQRALASKLERSGVGGGHSAWFPRVVFRGSCVPRLRVIPTRREGRSKQKNLANNRSIDYSPQWRHRSR